MTGPAFDPEKLRPAEHVLEPDPRNALTGWVDKTSGVIRPVQISKKSANPCPRNCDRLRLHAFRGQFHYRFGALIEFETRREHAAAATVTEWLS